MVDVARYAFLLASWNELGGVDDHFTLFYYARNNNTTDIEIVDPKHKRRQLSRMPYPHLKAEDVRPGGKLVIFGKQYSVLDYADAQTRETLGKSQQTCVDRGGGAALLGSLLRLDS